MKTRGSNNPGDTTTLSGIMSSVSQISHIISLSARSLLTQRADVKLENGMFIISIDVDVGSKELGVVNAGKNDFNVSRRFGEYSIGQIEEHSLPIFIDLFNDFEIPATFAMRGQLTESIYSMRDLFRESSIDHDIGAHGYYHRKFTVLTKEEADNELKMIEAGMRRSGIVPQSFVFPKNCVAHLDLLEAHGYKCYRSVGGLFNDRMLINKNGSLFDVHPSLYVDRSTNYKTIEKIVDISITMKKPFHIWFHLWSFGKNEEHIRRSVNKIFVPLFNEVRKRVLNNELTLETMLSASCKVDELINAA